MAIRAIIIVAVLAIAWIFLTKVCKIAIPEWVLHILWIVIGVIVAIVAIKFIAGII